jgi:hypothetical protein
MSELSRTCRIFQNFDESGQARRQHFKVPKIEMPMKEENGRYFCLTEDCAARGQSFQESIL